MKSSFHRRLRPIAPGSFSGFSSGPEGTLAGTATNPLALTKSQLNWTAATRAFPAAWLLLIFALGIAVMPGEKAAQSEPDRWDAPRHFVGITEEAMGHDHLWIHTVVSAISGSEGVSLIAI